MSSDRHGLYLGRLAVIYLLAYEHYKLNALENGHQVDSVYYDFSKVFDCMDHYVLLAKLSRVRFCDVLVNWFSDFFENMTQRLKICFSISEQIEASGVLRGSHYTPLLFILFFDNIRAYLKFSDNTLFEDDLKVFRFMNSYEDQSLLQLDLYGVWKIISI